MSFVGQPSGGGGGGGAYYRNFTGVPFVRAADNAQKTPRKYLLYYYAYI